MTTTVLRRRPWDIIPGAAAATAVWRRRYRQIVAGAAAAATVILRWGGKCWHVGIYTTALEEAIAAQMPKLTTGVAESVEPPWLSRRAHLRLMPGSSASLAPDSRSRAAVMLPYLLWLRAEQMLRWGMTVVSPINFHRLGRFVSYIFICRSTNQCTNLDYLVQCVFAQEGPVRLPQHLQYINRLSSPIRCPSLLRSPCSPLLTPRFPFSAVSAKACKHSNPKFRYRVSGARASDHTLTLLF